VKNTACGLHSAKRSSGGHLPQTPLFGHLRYYHQADDEELCFNGLRLISVSRIRLEIVFDSMRILVPPSVLRPTKRTLLFTSELGFLVLGLALTLAIASYIAVSNDCYNSVECPAFSGVLAAGVVLTIVGFVLLRRRTRSWKIEYDAVGWALAHERKLHPTRSRYKKVVSRFLVWLPSMIATTVLLFFPAASHLIQPGSQRLVHYRVSIPWTVVVTPVPGVPSESFVAAFTLIGSNGAFRLTPFWRGEIFSSQMGFGSTLHAPDASEDKIITERRHVGATQLSRRDFRMGDLALSCWQYLPPHDWPYRRRSIGSAALWQIDCQTPVGIGGQQFYASFRGSEADVPAFYKIIEGVAPVK
jgi:hypothetical protein